MKRVILYLIIYMLVGARVSAQELTFKNDSLPAALSVIRDSQTEYAIHFIHNDLEHLRVSARVKTKDVRKAVERVCKGQPVKVKTKGKQIFVQYKPEKDFTGKKIHLSGEVRDGFLDMPLPHARISVFKADSTLVADSLRMVIFYKGNMQPHMAVYGIDVSAAKREYLVRAQMEGYDDVWQRVAITDPSQDEVDVPALKMRKSTDKTMRELTVTATKIKMYYRGDTLIYDATAFKMPDGSMLDDLIRQLPGVTMNADGEIFVNGRKVDELLLGSRSFFGGNKKVLLENLPYYTVRHLKVYEKQTDRSEALGYDVDPRRYVMDVILKDEYNQGYIGNVEAAGGTNERWLGRGFLLGFTDKLRFTLLANANNVNESRHIGQSEAVAVAVGLFGEVQYGDMLDILLALNMRYGEAARDIRIHSVSADVLSDSVHDEHIEIVKENLAEACFGSGQNIRLPVKDLFSEEPFDDTGFVKCVLAQRDGAQNIGLVKDHPGDDREVRSHF